MQWRQEGATDVADVALEQVEVPIAVPTRQRTRCGSHDADPAPAAETRLAETLATLCLGSVGPGAQHTLQQTLPGPLVPMEAEFCRAQLQGGLYNAQFRSSIFIEPETPELSR